MGSIKSDLWNKILFLAIVDKIVFTPLFYWEQVKFWKTIKGLSEWEAQDPRKEKKEKGMDWHLELWFLLRPIFNSKIMIQRLGNWTKNLWDICLFNRQELNIKSYQKSGHSNKDYRFSVVTTNDCTL